MGVLEPASVVAASDADVAVVATVLLPSEPPVVVVLVASELTDGAGGTAVSMGAMAGLGAGAGTASAATGTAPVVADSDSVSASGAGLREDTTVSATSEMTVNAAC